MRRRGRRFAVGAAVLVAALLFGACRGLGERSPTAGPARQAAGPAGASGTIASSTSSPEHAGAERSEHAPDAASQETGAMASPAEAEGDPVPPRLGKPTRRAHAGLPLVAPETLLEWGLDGALGFEVRGADLDASDTAGWPSVFEAPHSARVFTLALKLHPRGQRASVWLDRAVDPAGRPRSVLVLGLGDDADRGIGLDATAWNDVALVSDLETTGNVRLVAGGEARGAWPGGSRVEALDSERVGAPVVGLTVSGASADWLRAAPERAFGLADLRFAPKATSSAHLLEPYGVAAEFTQREPARGFDFTAARLRQVVVADAGLEWVEGHFSRDEPVARGANGERDPEGQTPLARTCHAVVALGGGRVLVFGGELRDTHVGRMANGSDTWIYDMRDQTWERVEGAEPPPRCHIGMAVTPDGSVAFLQSGWFNAPREEDSFIYTDTWLFEREAQAWRRLADSDPLCEISDVQPVFDGARGLFVFPGTGSLWTLALPDGPLEWGADMPAFLQEPGGVRGLAERPYQGFPGEAMTWYDPVREVVLRWGGYVLDGRGGRELQKEVFAYSPERNVMVRRAALESGPSARVRGAVAFDTRRERMVLFGGILGGLDDRANDLWTYDPVAHAWTELRASNVPGPRGGYFGMAYDAELDAFSIPFGRQDRATFLDEVWRLELRPEAGGAATWKFEAEGVAGLLPVATWGAGPEGEVEWRSVAEDRWRSGAIEGGLGGRVEVRVSLPPGARLERLVWAQAALGDAQGR